MLALSKRNTNAAEVIIFLHRFVSVLVEYFKELEEESIRDNFVVIYELMDEMMDFGYPQTTESKILQESAAVPCTSDFSSFSVPSDTSLRSPTDLRSRPVHQWQSQMQFRGEQRASGTAKTRFFSMSLKASTCSYALSLSFPFPSLTPSQCFFRSMQKEP